MSGEGRYSLPDLTAVAQRYGVDAIFLTDNLTETIQYGLPLLRNILWLSESKRSIISIGSQAYLDEIERENRRQQDVLYVPGVEVCPRFYWTGSLRDKDLVCHDHQRNLIALGVTNAGVISGIPEARGYVWQKDAIWIVSTRLLLILLLVACVVLLTAPRRLARNSPYSPSEVGRSFFLGVILPLVALIIGANIAAARSPAFDIYHRSPGFDYEQRAVNYLREHDVPSYWAHPDARDAHEWKHMGVSFKTRTDPYPELLAFTGGYTGFGGVYEDRNTLTEPGAAWDSVLSEYAAGQRKAPVWCFGEMLYHYEGQAGKKLANVETMVWAGEKSAPALLEAIKKGKFYARRNTDNQSLILEEWKVDRSSSSNVVVTLKVSSRRPGETIRVRLIRDGVVAKEVSAVTPTSLALPDVLNAERRISCYRALVTGTSPLKLVTNPLFVPARGKP